ncbi:MAG: FAD-dependent oxidoreductase [Betaproteobacteria bacterium]|nr:FAD-dependent oxidoreductase [Betaproteobacteria bacterium]
MPTRERYSAIPSFWASTANPHPELPRLEHDIETDVAIVGGGFTGLTTAHYLARSGIDCVVLEANDAGWGASGRNGGMAVLRYKSGWAALAREHGMETARQMFRALQRAVGVQGHRERDATGLSRLARRGHRLPLERQGRFLARLLSAHRFSRAGRLLCARL